MRRSYLLMVIGLASVSLHSEVAYAQPKGLLKLMCQLFVNDNLVVNGPCDFVSEDTAGFAGGRELRFFERSHEQIKTILVLRITSHATLLWNGSRGRNEPYISLGDIVAAGNGCVKNILVRFCYAEGYDRSNFRIPIDVDDALISSVASRPPYFAVDEGCAYRWNPGPRANQCVADEQLYFDILKTRWSAIDQDIRVDCSAIAAANEWSHYETILACASGRMEARALEKPRQFNYR